MEISHAQEAYPRDTITRGWEQSPLLVNRNISNTAGLLAVPFPVTVFRCSYLAKENPKHKRTCPCAF